MTSEPPLLCEPDLITPAWLTEVLTAAGADCSVTALTHEPVGVGLMARSHRFTLEAVGDVASSVVIKFPSADPNTRTMGATAYRREVGFYRDVAPRVGGRVPRCHLASVSDDGTDFVLVLEDVAPASPGDQLVGVGFEEAAAAVANLAAIHASTWDDHTIADAAWLANGSGITLDDVMPTIHTIFADRFAGMLDDRTWPVLAAFAESVGRWNELEPPSRALVHGDYRLDNLLFAPDGSEVVAVDWQTADLRSPARDLAYFLGNSLTVEDRRAHEDELLDLYEHGLVDAGVARDVARLVRTDLLHGMFQGPLITMLGAFTASRSERSEAMFAVMADRCAAQILDHDALDILR